MLIERPFFRATWRASAHPSPAFVLAMSLHAAALAAMLLAPQAAQIQPPSVIYLAMSSAAPTPVASPKPVPRASARPVDKTPVSPPKPLTLAQAPEGELPAPTQAQAAPVNELSTVTAPPSQAASAAASVPPEPRLIAAIFDAAYLNNPKPDYPYDSLRMGEKGLVLLRVRVTAQGVAAAVELEKSSGFARLDRAARNAVRNWRFVPARMGEQAVESTPIVPVNFDPTRS